MKIYNTYSDRLEDLILNKNVTIYVCGLTPYDNAHIGHARTYVAYDLLKRYLIFKGHKVFHIQNITDIDDKLIDKSKETGEDPIKIADKFHSKALEEFKKLNILPADVYPKVSEHLSKIYEIIEILLKKGIAYKTKTGIYFNIFKFERYGKLSKQNLNKLSEHRIEPDPNKINPGDFALWKYTDDYQWDSPFGKGRPGWHIECSAMSLYYSNNNTIDIHGGAKDLIFPHHENEIAQSECYLEKQFVRYWVHTGFLTVNGQKMSKSLKNFITIEDALKRYDHMALRLFFLSSKYSSPIDFSDATVKQAEEFYKSIKRFYNYIHSTSVNYSSRNRFDNSIQEFFNALDNDLDTPKALSILNDIMTEAYKGINIFEQQVLIKFMNDFDFIFGLNIKKDPKLEKLLNNLDKLRTEYRKQKKFDVSDKIREAIANSDIEVKDSKDKSEYIY